MQKLAKPLLWWALIAIVWGTFRLFSTSEVYSELIAKPIIWLGITAFFIWKHYVPREVFEDLRKNYLSKRPLWLVFVLPVVFTGVYFGVINFHSIVTPQFSLSLVLATIGLNFTTSFVEEFVYRGVLYVWLMHVTNEVAAFVLVQVLFLLVHVPILVMQFESPMATFSRIFFILLLGIVHTAFFRFSKSLYASTLSHGTWNTLVQYFLLAR